MSDTAVVLALGELRALLEGVAARLDAIERRLEAQGRETRRMDEHVTFVESVYDRVKSPFHFVMDAIRPRAPVLER
jgi:acyl transferase domain-containing protein